MIETEATFTARLLKADTRRVLTAKPANVNVIDKGRVSSDDNYRVLPIERVFSMNTDS